MDIRFHDWRFNRCIFGFLRKKMQIIIIFILQMIRRKNVKINACSFFAVFLESHGFTECKDFSCNIFYYL